MRDRRSSSALAFGASAALVYYFSNPKPSFFYDYTFRVASRLLRGSAGLGEVPPSWLNEFVPFGGDWYSVFPLGSVLSMMPFAVLKELGIIREMPAALIASLLAGVAAIFLVKIGESYGHSRSRIILQASALLFGTFVWANLTMAGAWQLALGFSLVGTLGAIYFTVFVRKPALAGAFFALAFGNRTEILLTAPLLLYWMCRPQRSDPDEEDTDQKDRGHTLQRVAAFCAVPFVLGVSTLAYNYARFGSIADFGYARIPGVLDEPWYNHGIFSVWYIPRQAWEMLLRLWEVRPAFPYITPNPFSSSILLSSPFLLLAFRRGSRDRALKLLCWIAIAVLTIVLWMHGNSGGWQFGYRYWIVALPWVYLILNENAPAKISRTESALYVFSFSANIYAVWLFHWTNYLKP